MASNLLFNLRSQGGRIYSDKQSCSISARAGGVGGNTGIYKIGEQLRVLTPLEAERLMGFPDGYTNIETAPNSARYKALGNSIIPAKLEWLGRRIEAVEQIMKGKKSKVALQKQEKDKCLK